MLRNLLLELEKDFPLELNGETVTIRGRKGSKIIEQDLLLVFVNDVPQVLVKDIPSQVVVILHLLKHLK